uniref:Uncharacterized protein n=1 Tax=Nelumbo nucifera TaxID=4432 RepID=A0A822ZP15_NELNU|nr:TPA_asm: hypothetical protein HUJ06_016480 [Nelumbo nucifera]
MKMEKTKQNEESESWKKKKLMPKLRVGGRLNVKHRRVFLSKRE